MDIFPMGYWAEFALAVIASNAKHMEMCVTYRWLCMEIAVQKHMHSVCV